MEGKPMASATLEGRIVTFKRLRALEQVELEHARRGRHLAGVLALLGHTVQELDNTNKGEA